MSCGIVRSPDLISPRPKSHYRHENRMKMKKASMASDEKLKRSIKIENVDTRQSPPKAIVDCSPLQPAISKNKEALKIKLMVRRPIAQLVDQGIIPSLKSSPALHEQRKQLERAKTGDILKAKIQQRPDRQELERRHILEHDEGHVDPSLAERQRMLKKARLADQLNSQLSHRPGPLELIKKNILHTEEPIERIVKEGLISFKATSEGLLNRPQHPNGYETYEDDSQSSEGDLQNSPAAADSNEATASTSAIIPISNDNTVFTTVVTQAKLPPTYYTPIETIAKSTEPFQVKPETSNLFAELCQSVIDTSTLNYAPNKLSSLVTTLPAVQIPQSISTPVQNKCDAPGKDKNRKKNKLKPITKTRTIKFHEYKGPPNAQKNGLLCLSTEETSYQLLLKQQNCLLEYLEGLHKNAPASAAAAAGSNTKPIQADTQTFSLTNNFMQQSSPVMLSPSAAKPASPVSAITDPSSFELSKLEKMKVSDLKLLLKTRNLPVSGPKPQLIERLRPFATQDAAESMTSENSNADDDSQSRISPVLMETDAVDMHEVAKPRSNADLLREQQRKIDELQRKLKQSQQELQQMQMKQSQSTVILTQTDIPKPELLNHKQIFKQQLEAKIQKDKLQKLENLQKMQMEQQQQQQQLLQQQEMQRRKQENVVKIQENFTAKPIISSNFVGQPAKNPNEFVWNGESTILLVNFPDDKKYVLSSNPQTGTMQNFLVPITTTAPNINAIVKKINLSSQVQSPPPPVSLNLTQITPSKMSSHPMSVDKQPNKIPNILEHPRLPSMNTAITMDNSSEHALHSANLNNVMLNNVADTIPFNTPSIVKKEYSLFDAAPSSDATMNDLLLSANAMDTLSPMPQADDSCNSFDLFLSEAAQSHNEVAKQSDHKMGMSVKKEPSLMQPLSTSDTCPVDLKTFDDLELMELMGQQLDMDISDDSCQPMTGIKDDMCDRLNHSQSSMVGCRREMNPSLQPSLSELIQQQQNQQQIRPHHSLNNQRSNSSSNNDTNNNLSSSLDSNPNNNLIDYNNPFYLGNQSNLITTPGGLHLGSMDIEYFDNTLAQFDFALPPSNLQLSTPNQSSAPVSFDSADQQMANSAMTSSANYYPNSSSNSHVLDLFNIDDFKMSADSLPWSEVDYAV